MPRPENDRDKAIVALKAGLRRRSDRTWSVRGGRGTSWGWILVTAPPSRLNEYGSMTKADQDELTRIFGEPVHHQGVSIPASNAYREAYLERVLRGSTTRNPQPYWDRRKQPRNVAAAVEHAPSGRGRHQPATRYHSHSAHPYSHPTTTKHRGR